MKKWLPYLLGGLLFVLVAILVLSNSRQRERRINERITLRQKDKIPYGTAAARQLLPSLFPASRLTYDTRSPGNWDSIVTTSYNQAVVIVATDFNADDEELQRLLDFVRQGNYVFLIARSFSDEASRFFNFSYNSYMADQFMRLDEDSLAVSLEPAYFGKVPNFVYPGKRYESVFTELDSNTAAVLGRNERGQPNFIAINAGAGSIFIHAAPLAFSNYFVLHKNNAAYFQRAFSMIPTKVDHLVWNEYYLAKPARRSNDGEPDWFRVLLRYPALRWGLLTGLGTLLLFALLSSRRKQRAIPPYTRPRNESLDFVKTIGRLYYDRRDHANLANKMAVYFLGHVRTTYKLPTHTLDTNFIQALHFKSGYGMKELEGIISFIHYLQGGGTVTEQKLSDFHRHLEKFYQTT